MLEEMGHPLLFIGLMERTNMYEKLKGTFIGGKGIVGPGKAEPIFQCPVVDSGVAGKLRPLMGPLSRLSSKEGCAHDCKSKEGFGEPSQMVP